MFLCQSSYAAHNLRMPELRHCWEEMMFNLVVEVGHPPVTPERGLDVHCVEEGVLDPVKGTRCHGEMRVGEGKVPENVD